MKVKLGIIIGVVIWILINLTSLFVKPTIIDNVTYTNLIVPICIIIITGFFSILYIREIDENELIEGIKIGILIIIIDIILDMAFFIIPNRPNILLSNYPNHVLIMSFITLIITTFLGYLAQMNIELK